MKKIILWDFDGVIMDSMSIRDLGFRKTLAMYPDNQIEALLDFHLKNGGLSRYVKFRYFFEEIRKETITEVTISELAERFSKIMLEMLIDENLLIEDTVNFIKYNYKNYKFHIVSGSDEIELNKICSSLSLDQFFVSIKGSPTPKTQLVSDILKKFKYNLSDVCLIGDSQNDKDAAVNNNITFYGYNNPGLKKDNNYIDNFH